MKELTRGELRCVEQALRAAADNIVYAIEEGRDIYIEDDVLDQIREAITIIEGLLNE
jgi:hypothetical protein